MSPWRLGNIAFERSKNEVVSAAAVSPPTVLTDSTQRQISPLIAAALLAKPRPELDWMFWGWLKAFVQYSFYPVVANAVVYVFGRVLTGFIATNAPPWDGPSMWSLLFPMTILMVAFIFGVLQIPKLVNDLFAGRSGSSAVPSSLG